MRQKRRKSKLDYRALWLVIRDQDMEVIKQENFRQKWNDCIVYPADELLGKNFVVSSDTKEMVLDALSKDNPRLEILNVNDYQIYQDSKSDDDIFVVPTGYEEGFSWKNRD